MKTYKRICIKDCRIEKDGLVLSLKRGQEYITSREINGRIMVFTGVWGKVSANLFAGAVRFT